MTRYTQNLSRRGSVRLAAILLSLVGGLTLLGVCLNQQFNLGRGPLRSADPRIVIWSALAAITLVLILWLRAMRARRRVDWGEER